MSLLHFRGIEKALRKGVTQYQLSTAEITNNYSKLCKSNKTVTRDYHGSFQRQTSDSSFKFANNFCFSCTLKKNNLFHEIKSRRQVLVSKQIIDEQGSLVKESKTKEVPSNPADKLYQDAMDEIKKNSHRFALASLKDALPLYKEMKNAEGEMKTLEQTAKIHMFHKDFDKALEVYLALESTSREHQDKPFLLRSLFGSGTAYSQLLKLGDAKTKLKEARDIAEELKETKKLANITANIGLVFSLEGITESAIKYLEDSLKMAKNNRDIQEEVNSAKLLAKEYAKIKDWEKSNDLYNYAAQMSRNIADGLTEWQALEAIGKNYVKMGKFADAVEMHKKGLALGDRMAMMSLKFESGFNLVQAYRLDGDEAQALKTANALLVFCNEWGYKRATIATLLQIAELETGLNQFDQAKKRLEEGLELIKDLDSAPKEHALCLYQLGIIAEKQQDHTNAKKYLEDSLIKCKGMKNQREGEDLERRILILVADIHRKLNENEKAIQSLRRAVEINMNFKDDNALLNCFVRMGHIFKKLEKQKDAAIWTAAAVQVAAKLKEKGQLKGSPEGIQLGKILFGR